MAHVMSILAMCLIHVFPAHAHSIPSDAEREEALISDLKKFGKSKGYAFYDVHRSWSFDANCDGRDDRLVQSAFSVNGGNGVALHYLIYESQSGVEKRTVEVQLLGGIKDVVRDGSNLVLTMSKHLSGDPMCCPSGVVRQRIALCGSKS